MAYSDPEQEITEYFAALKMPTREDSKSLRIVKQRGNDKYGAFAVLIEDIAEHKALFACYLTKDEQQLWHVKDSIGGVDYHNILPGERPIVNLSGSGWPQYFFALGHVVDDSQRTRYVRLTTANGIVLEDTVENNLVLFATDNLVALPVQVELYNQDNETIGDHYAFVSNQRKVQHTKKTLLQSLWPNSKNNM
jgi:hypothetical protein